MARVLLVEDDAALLDVLSAVLEQDGHHVEIARQGAEALEKLSTGELPDLVLLDLLMPVMDGWTCLSRMRERPEFAPVQVLVMSAGNRAAEEAAAHGVGLLSKPFCMSSVLDLLARIDATAGSRSSNMGGCRESLSTRTRGTAA